MRLYTKEINEHSELSATWLPNIRISLGDVGKLRFITSAFERLWHSIQENIRRNNPLEFDYNSKDGVSIQVKSLGKHLGWIQQ